MIGERKDAALLVPTTAIRQAQGTDASPFVWRIAGGALEKRNVLLGVVDDAAGIAEVKEGLAAGDRVVVGNVGALGNGAKVTIAGGKSSQSSSDVSIKRPVFATMIMVALVVLGIVGYCSASRSTSIPTSPTRRSSRRRPTRGHRLKS
ncbi:MAG: hypothetical protein U5K74_11350 [Gemmatimonadaceae bacterium]|nr:hypothetical protein [Gemmatimonadaceae bacterium]